MASELIAVTGDHYIQDALEKQHENASSNAISILSSVCFASIAYAARKVACEDAKTPSSLNNPFEGQPENAKQLSETVAEFTKRLPPLTSRSELVGDWIWVANPNAKQPKPQDVQKFMDSGMVLLETYKSKRQRLQEELPGKHKATITKKLSPDREALKTEINKLASETGVLAGKVCSSLTGPYLLVMLMSIQWMLRPSLEDLSRVWRCVAEAVTDGRLGPCAKVPPEGSTDCTAAKDSVVIVYTDDFRKQKDVQRVLRELNNLGLVPREGHGKAIYYKTDAYTYLGIHSENEYNIRASLYTSNEMLSMMPQSDHQISVKNKKRTLDSYFKGS